MKAIGLISSKGGVGKSTLAIHIAALAGDAVLVDLDPQQSAAAWWRTRDAERPQLALGTAAELAGALRTYGHAVVVVDTAPHDVAAARLVAAACGLVVIPVRPSIMDLRAIAVSIDAVRHAKGRAVVVINAAPAGRGTAEASVVAEARAVLADYGLPVSPVVIRQRVAFSHALNDGRAVHEFAPDSPAAAELRALWEWINGAYPEAGAFGAGKDGKARSTGSARNR